MGTDGADAVPEAAFGALANETRLAIVRTLGDRSGDGEYVALSFSELQDAVGVETSGKLSYHLERLTETFLERRDGGYALNVPGVYVYQSLVGGAYSEPMEVAPFEVDGRCGFCDGALEISYEEFRVWEACSVCEASFARYPILPGSLSEELHEQLVRCFQFRLVLDRVGFTNGVCPYCSGQVSISVNTGSEKAWSDQSEFLGRPYVEYVCQKCHWFYVPTLDAPLRYLPATVEFLYRHGVNVFTEPKWSDKYGGHDRVVSEQPWRAQVATWVDDDEIVLTVNEELEILGIEERSATPGEWPRRMPWDADPPSDDPDEDERSATAGDSTNEPNSGPATEPSPGVDSGDVDDAFETLADETRLSIVQVLGDRSDDGAFVALSYADLKDAVGVRDSGRFGYHLRKLTDRFLEKTEDGYALDVPGIYVYRALSTEAYGESPEVEPFPIDGVCEFCGGRLRMAYRDYRGRVECGDCGTTHLQYPLPPASLGEEPTDQLPRALQVRLLLDKLGMHHGVCPYCSGRVESTVGADLDPPEGRETDREHAFVEYVCRNCRWYLDTTVSEPFELHPAVISFLYRHDVDAFEDPAWTSAYQSFDRVVSADPWRAEAAYVVDGEELRLTVDGGLNLATADEGERTTEGWPPDPPFDAG